MAAIADKPMAKKMGRPKSSERDDVTIKFDRLLANKARHVALAKGVPMVEYLSELARGQIERDYAKILRAIEEEGGKSE